MKLIKWKSDELKDDIDTDDLPSQLGVERDDYDRADSDSRRKDPYRDAAEDSMKKRPSVDRTPAKTKQGELRSGRLASASSGGGLSMTIASGSASRRSGGGSFRQPVRPVALTPLVSVGKGGGRSATGENIYAEAARSLGAMSGQAGKQALFDAQLANVDGSAFPGEAGGIMPGDIMSAGAAGAAPQNDFKYQNVTPWWWDWQKQKAMERWKAWDSEAWSNRLGMTLQELAFGVGLNVSNQLANCLITGDFNGKFSDGYLAGSDDAEFVCKIGNKEVPLSKMTYAPSTNADGKPVSNQASGSDFESICNRAKGEIVLSGGGPKKNCIQKFWKKMFGRIGGGKEPYSYTCDMNINPKFISVDVAKEKNKDKVAIYVTLASKKGETAPASAEDIAKGDFSSFVGFVNKGTHWKSFNKCMKPAGDPCNDSQCPANTQKSSATAQGECFYIIGAGAVELLKYKTDPTPTTRCDNLDKIKARYSKISSTTANSVTEYVNKLESKETAEASAEGTEGTEGTEEGEVTDPKLNGYGWDTYFWSKRSNALKDAYQACKAEKKRAQEYSKMRMGFKDIVQGRYVSWIDTRNNQIKSGARLTPKGMFGDIDIGQCDIDASYLNINIGASINGIVCSGNIEERVLEDGLNTFSAKITDSSGKPIGDTKVVAVLLEHNIDKNNEEYGEYVVKGKKKYSGNSTGDFKYSHDISIKDTKGYGRMVWLVGKAGKDIVDKETVINGEDDNIIVPQLLKGSTVGKAAICRYKWCGDEPNSCATKEEENKEEYCVDEEGSSKKYYLVVNNKAKGEVAAATLSSEQKAAANQKPCKWDCVCEEDEDNQKTYYKRGSDGEGIDSKICANLETLKCGKKTPNPPGEGEEPVIGEEPGEGEGNSDVPSDPQEGGTTYKPDFSFNPVHLYYAFGFNDFTTPFYLDLKNMGNRGDENKDKDCKTTPAENPFFMDNCVAGPLRKKYKALSNIAKATKAKATKAKAKTAKAKDICTEMDKALNKYENKLYMNSFATGESFRRYKNYIAQFLNKNQEVYSTFKELCEAKKTSGELSSYPNNEIFKVRVIGRSIRNEGVKQITKDNVLKRFNDESPKSLDITIEGCQGQWESRPDNLASLRAETIKKLVEQGLSLTTNECKPVEAYEGGDQTAYALAQRCVSFEIKTCDDNDSYREYGHFASFQRVKMTVKYNDVRNKEVDKKIQEYNERG